MEKNIEKEMETRAICADLALGFFFEKAQIGPWCIPFVQKAA